MNHRERIHAALHGEPVDRVPVSLWRHFPNDDLAAETLAARVAELQKKYDFDFVKVTPASSFPAEMYGATLKDAQNREGTRAYLSRPVSSLADWDKIVPLDGKNPVFARDVTAIHQVRQQVGFGVHILQTVFSPLNTLHNLAGDAMLADLRARPDVIRRALRAVTETTTRFAVESLRAGADAIFFATQMATSARVTLDEFSQFGEPYDLQVLEAIRAAKSDFVFLHIHGLDIYFDALTRYPVQVINWHDRRTAPTLKQARGKWKGALAGGLEEYNVLRGKSRDAVAAQARDAIAQAAGGGFILGAGCVMMVDTPEDNVRAAIEAVRG